MSVALFTCNLGMILELVGATSASLMAYIIPPLCYLKLSWNQVDYKLAMPKEKKVYYIQGNSKHCMCIIWFCGYVYFLIYDN